MNKTQYLLTGATGWLGKRVALAITEGLEDLWGYDFRGQSLRCLIPEGEDCSELASIGAEIIRGSVTDEEALSKFTANASGCILIHLSGVIHPPGKTSYFDIVNFLGAKKLIQAAKNGGIKRVVAMSSNSPFGGNGSSMELFNEDSPYNPYMGYGASKMKMEKMLLEAINKDGPEIVIIRSPWFYGPGQPPRQTLFFQMIREGKFPLIGSGINKRSMGYVDSLALGVLLASKVPEAKNQVFWIADQDPYSMVEIINTVKKVLVEDFGMVVSNKQLKLPNFVSDIARVADFALQGIGLYNQKIHVLSEMNMTIACDISKAKKILGYVPVVGLRQGMRKSIEWCLKNNLKI